jgi:heavy metal translocating P-type ATPase
LNMGQDIKAPCECRVIHELPGRLRIRCAGFHDPSFDSAYMEAVLKNIAGVTRVRFNTGAATVVVGYNRDENCRRRIMACLGSLPAEAYQPLKASHTTPDSVGVAAKSVLALLTPAIPRRLRAMFSWAMGLPTLVRGAETLLTDGVKVEVLDAAAVGFSLGRKDYFTANAITALLSLGEYLEQVTEAKTTGLLSSLLRPRVDVVRVERDGAEIRLAVGDVMVGDRVVCGPGEMAPVDGRVIEGEASINQSSITGESFPVHARPGDDVLSGSLIQEGRITMDARQVGAETNMARINRFLENSLRFKSPSQKQSDALADRLVPAALGLGFGLYLLTRDIRRAAAVLTVDYSCAIKLANPVAVKTAMYAAAHEGVLLKGAQALDALARADIVVFDKTGTLTRGALEVTDIVPVGGMPPDELLALAASAEMHYAHPAARAVVAEARNRNLTPPLSGRVDFIVAHGVSAYVAGRRILVGSHHFIGEDEGVDCSGIDALAGALRKNGKSLLYVARENKLQGIIALRDALRPEADQALRDLKAAGIEKIIALTGDHPDTARAIAKKLPALDDIFWDLKPEQKAAIVTDLQKNGHRIAFAGDGVNDAPALITADVGICMPGGADLARESAQVVLLKEDLNALVTARRIAVQTEKIIKTCFHASVGLNSLFLLLAGAGRIPPVMAAVLHNANTVGVLGYAAMAGMRKS